MIAAPSIRIMRSDSMSNWTGRLITVIMLNRKDES